jgi:glutathione S-transferase
MKLYYTKRSPYASKVRMVALGRDVQLELVDIPDLSQKPAELLASNPLGKIPALLLDDGQSLFDSRVICQYLDTLGEREKLIPHKGVTRYQVLKIESLADGMADAAVAMVMEKASHGENIVSESIIARHNAAILRGLEYLNAHHDMLSGEWNLAQIAVAATLGYLNFRLKDLGWQAKFPNLSVWYDKVLLRSDVQATLPKM